MEPRQDVFGSYERSEGGWMFRDRSQAGARLAAALHAYRGSNPLVLGIPRGGVPVAYEVAQQLEGDLDIIVARKIGAPSQPELGIGAVAADGSLYDNVHLRKLLDISDAQFARLAEPQRLEAEQREEHFRRGLPALRPEGRSVIVVDDGLATGATLRAALRSLRARNAQSIMVAVPVGALDACHSIAAEVDDLVCLHYPQPFNAVGQHYRVFEQTSDQEVEHLLRTHRRLRAKTPRPPRV